jgi:hypothetical protein
VIARFLWLRGRCRGEFVQAPVPRQQGIQFVAFGATGDDPLEDVGQIGKRLKAAIRSMASSAIGEAEVW